MKELPHNLTEWFLEQLEESYFEQGSSIWASLLQLQYSPPHSNAVPIYYKNAIL